MVDPQPPWLAAMTTILGLFEFDGDADNQAIIAMAQACGGEIAKTYKHDTIPWCALATNYVLVATGFKSNDNLWALDFARYGSKLSGPAVGAIATKARFDGAGKQIGGHVFLIVGRTLSGQIVGRGGNQSDMVCDTLFDPAAISGYNWPLGAALPKAIGFAALPIVAPLPKEHRSVSLDAAPVPKFCSFVPGGFYSADPIDKTLPVSIRMNNPGALNWASWIEAAPGYVSNTETTPTNRTVVFSSPECGIAAWWKLMEKYRAAGAITIEQIIQRYGGGQDYSDYVTAVRISTGLAANFIIRLAGDDANLLRFAKAMFKHEAGRPTPLTDQQIMYGFGLARGTIKMPAQPPGGAVVQPATTKPQISTPPSAAPSEVPSKPQPSSSPEATGFWARLVAAIVASLGRK